MSKSQLEAEFWGVLEIMSKAEGWPYPLPEREFRFAPPRKWRFDFCWPAYSLAVEIDGGIYTNGRHVRGKGYEADMEKLNRATQLGWRVLRFSQRQVRSGEALQQVEWALKAASPVPEGTGA